MDEAAKRPSSLPAGVSKERREHRRIPALGPAKVMSVSDSGAIQDSNVQLQDFSQGGYGVLTEYKLPVGELVWVERQTGDLQKAVVRYSRHVGGLEWRTGLRLLEKERRSADRDRVNGAAFLSWLTPNGSHRSTAVTVVDISDTGAGVVAAEQAPVGVLATLRGSSLVCSCLIKRCDPDRKGYRVGLLFTSKHKDKDRESSREWLD